MIGGLNWPTIVNAENFPQVSRLILHLTSQFLNIFEHFGKVIFKCSRFPYKQTVINEWFTLPDDKNDRELPVKVINVDEGGKTNKCYYTQDHVDNFLDSLIDYHYEVFYHGTGQKYAQEIIEDGIDVRKGTLRQDFSNGDGFYLGDDFEEACSWAEARAKRYSESHGKANSAVLVFRVKKTELHKEDTHKGLNLRNDKKRWQEVVKQFRSGEPDLKFVKSLRKHDFIEGPMASMSSRNPDFNHPRQRDGTYQLCVKRDGCAELFDRSLHSVIFFEH